MKACIYGTGSGRGRCWQKSAFGSDYCPQHQPKKRSVKLHSSDSSALPSVRMIDMVLLAGIVLVIILVIVRK